MTSHFLHSPTAKFSLNCLKPHCRLRRRSRPSLVAAAPQSHWGDHGRWAGAEVLRQDAPHVRVQHNEASDEDSWRHVCLFVVFRHHGKMTLQGSVLLPHPSLQASWRTSVCRNWVPRSGRAACSAWTTRHRPRRRRRWSGTMPTCTSQAKLRCQDTQTPRKIQPQNGHCSPLRAGTDRVFFQPACSPDPSQIDSWAWTAVKREVFAIRGSIPLKAEASLAWAAVLPFQHLEGLLRGGENRLHRVSPTKLALFEHISTVSLKMCCETRTNTRTTPHINHQTRHTQTLLYFTHK